jgi:hypothetical protein
VRFIVQELTRRGLRSIVESFSDWQAPQGEVLLGFGDRVFSKMKNARGENGIGPSRFQHIGEMLEFARATTGNHRYAD